jgi:hypothetical protein
MFVVAASLRRPIVVSLRMPTPALPMGYMSACEKALQTELASADYLEPGTD